MTNDKNLATNTNATNTNMATSTTSTDAGTTARTTRFVRLVPLAAATALLATACGSTTTTTSPGDSSPAASVDSAPVTDVPTTTIAAVTTTDAPVVTDPAPTTVPVTTAAPEPTAVCGVFGPMPPRPDSMDTQFFDTNGDGEPDFVTAYAGDGEGWKLRVVEDGITSEAPIPDAAGFAGIIGSVDVETRDHVQVRDFETNDVHTYATNAEGCVELITTDPGPDGDPTDDLTLTNPAPPAPCGDFGAIPADSQITSDLSVDLNNDGTADDQVVTYLDGVYKLRTVRNGVISEYDVADVGVSSIRALGVGDVGEISDGNEVVVRTGGGASSARIGFFGHDADGCLFEFTRNGSPLEVYVGATIGSSSGAACGEGYIAQWEYSLDDDDTYFGSSAAFFESTAGDFTYMPASDDFSEGLSLDELTPAELQCFDFGL